MTSSFSPKALSFLRALKRNNDREWFKARKEQYDTLLRAPMIAIIEQLAAEFPKFAPDLIANPKTSLPDSRDTRFENKRRSRRTSRRCFPAAASSTVGAGLSHLARGGVSRRDARAGHSQLYAERGTS